MKLFLKNIIFRLFLILLILIPIDLLTGLLLDNILKRQPDGRYYKAEYSLNRSCEEIFILGSSRAETNLNPIIFEEMLDMKCWNAGRGGQSLPYFRCIQECVLKRYAPKVLVLNVEYNLCEKSLEYWYEKAGFLKPFYRKNPEIRPILNEISRFEKYYMYSSIYAYNSSFYYLLRPFFKEGIDGKNEHKGWKPMDGIMSEEILIQNDNDSLIQSEIIPKALYELNVLLESFSSAGTKIIVVISPDFYPRERNTPTLYEIESFSRKYNFPILDYTTDTAFVLRNELFFDSNHLNRDGAVKLSESISYYIKYCNY